MTDRMVRKIEMLSNRSAFIITDITFVSVYLLSDTIFSFFNIYSFGTDQTKE